MHIALAAQGGPGWAGGAEYIRNLARAAKVADPSTRLTLVCGTKQAAEWEPHARLFEAVVPVASKRLPRPAEWLLGRNRELHQALRQAAPDFFYPLTYDNAYNLGATFPLGKLPCAWAGWIPDFQHRHLPDLFSEKERKRRDAGIAALVAEAPHIVLSSESAAEDFRRFYPQAAHKAAVLTFATFPEPDWYEDGGEDLSWLPPRFLAVSNQFWSHKNHILIFEALSILAARGMRPVVVCTGALIDFRQPDHCERLLQQIHRAGLGSQVLLLGRVDRRVQIEILRRSVAVIQPSLFEGWSTVVEDSRVLGKAILLSDLPVHQEQNPPGASFFPRRDPSALAERIAEAWEKGRCGPDRAAEREARARAEARIREVGETFLKIAAGQ